MILRRWYHRTFTLNFDHLLIVDNSERRHKKNIATQDSLIKSCIKNRWVSFQCVFQKGPIFTNEYICISSSLKVPFQVVLWAWNIFLQTSSFSLYRWNWNAILTHFAWDFHHKFSSITFCLFLKWITSSIPSEFIITTVLFLFFC